MKSKGVLKTSTSEGDIEDTPPQLTLNTAQSPSPTPAPVIAPTPAPAPYPAPASISAPNINKSTFKSATSANKQAYNQQTPTSSFTKNTSYASLQKNHKYNYGTNFRHKAAKYILAKNITAQNKAMHIYSPSGSKMSIDSLLCDKLEIWKQSVSNGLGRLAQVIADVHSNDSIEFILKIKVSSHKKVTYTNMVCDICPKRIISIVYG